MFGSQRIDETWFDDWIGFRTERITFVLQSIDCSFRWIVPTHSIVSTFHQSKSIEIDLNDDNGKEKERTDLREENGRKRKREEEEDS